MIDPNARLHAMNTAWGQGYMCGIDQPQRVRCPPGWMGDQWARGYRNAAVKAKPRE